MQNLKHILIICGEPSGDLHAAGLAQEILNLNHKIKISAVGGKFLKEAGAKIYYDIKELSVLGLFNALKKLPKFCGLKKLILRKIKEEKPDCLILVDFSGFNLRLAKEINKSIPIIYYISPQVWASRQGRVQTIKNYIHKMLVLFKFEEEFYREYGIDATFVGHPLLDTVKPTMVKEEFLNEFGLSESKTIIALLPGSRRQEIENILPIMLKTSSIISEHVADIQFVIAKPPQLDRDIYERKISGINLDLKIIEGKTYDCLNVASFCLVASGTATLDTAIMQKPFAIVYKMNLLNYLFYRPQIKVPCVGMVNIIAKRKIIPEFIQFKAKPKKIAEEVLSILNNPSRLEQMKNDLAFVKSSLGEKGASFRAAKIILNQGRFSSRSGTVLL